MRFWLVLGVGVAAWLAIVLGLARLMANVARRAEAAYRCGLCNGPALPEAGALFSDRAQRRVCAPCLRTTRPMT